MVWIARSVKHAVKNDEDSTMKRNMEIIRSILLAVEDGNDPNQIEGATDEQVRYHQALLVEAGLVHGNVTFYLSNASEVPDVVKISKLSWQGHEFIDLAKQQQIWNTIKSEFKEASFGTVIAVAKDLAEGWAKKRVQELISS